MRIPNWVVYALVVVTIVVALFSRGEDNLVRPGQAPYDIAVTEKSGSSDGPPLPASNPFDEQVLVQVGDAEDGIGTAFAINRSGAWLTARHVVEGCERVGLAVGDGRMVRVDEVRISRHSDLALLITDRAPAALKLDLDRELRIGEAGYHVGFPQGRTGEARSELRARSKLVTRGRYVTEEPVLAWDEQQRSDGIEGTLSGMSGGPVFDSSGAVIGVTVAESPTRGRIYASGPETIRRFLDEQNLAASGEDAYPLAASSFVREADRLRDEQAIVKVLCRVSDT
jgi:S1-C subfamily serine protease